MEDLTLYDVTVIGAGVIGTSIARELSKYKLKTLIIEKNAEVCQGTTKANSAIVHGGYDAHEGSLKAKLNVWGNSLYSELSKELEFSFERIGSLVVAFTDDEIKSLKSVYQRGINNGVLGLKIIDGNRARAIEPGLSAEVVGALYCSSAGIVCPFNLTFALIENAIENGVELLTNNEVKDIEILDDRFKLMVEGNEIFTRYIINAAGLYSDKIAQMIGDNEFKIMPRKGEYRILDRNVGDSVKRVIFQVPTKSGKGILVAPTVHGNIIVGPTADYVNDVEDTTTTSIGIKKIDELAKKSLPNIELEQNIRVFSGVRASCEKKDFMIYPSRQANHFINVGAIDSPGIASAPAIAKYVIGLLKEQGLDLKDNINFNLESDSNSLIIEEREIKLNDGKKANLQFVSIADMQKDAKDLSIKFLPYSLLISILFSAVISLIYAKLIKNNLQEIKIVTDKMMKLDKKTRLKVSSNDEVGELKQQINDLYSTLLRTIDDLEFKNKEILKLEKLKYDFFKGASHELKTPLASLKIILENMKYNIGKYKERDIYINECIEIVDSLTKNISQILSVHSIENLNNDEEYLKINDTLEDVLKKYEILAHQKKITVNNYILDENVYIGKTALKIILSNLISNAVKYTDVNGVINIGIVNDWLYIENTYGNNKISNMDKIFDVKFDLNKENSNGLGLYIVSNILNNYNIEYKALQDEEFFIFKIKIFS